jgi:hypothetical protein
MAGHLDAERGSVVDCCDRMETSGLLERIESGTVKQRRVKAKRADEVRQHHTYYRLSRTGDHLLRFHDERAGKLNVLRHLPGARTLAARLAREGAGSPRTTAAESDEPFEEVRHRYRALRRVGLLATREDPPATLPDGAGGDGHTWYATTPIADRLLADFED